MEPDLIACYAVIWLTRSSNTIPLPLETKLKINKAVRTYLLPLTEQLRQLRMGSGIEGSIWFTLQSSVSHRHLRLELGRPASSVPELVSCQMK